MKIIHHSLSLLLFLLGPFSLMAQDQKPKKEKLDFEKSKTINKSYNISASDKLSVHNSFGTVEVHSWSKNEITVDISISAGSNKEAFAQKLLDGITIDAQQKGNEISIKTVNKGGSNDKGTKSNMSINYSIHMPAGNPLSISNEFGATILPDHSGEVNLTSKFGSLKTGTLKNVDNITVEFGNANIESIANGDVTVKYSKAVIGKLVGKVKLNFEFCGDTRVSMDNDLAALDLRAAYSTVNLRPVGNPSASYRIATSYGNFKNTTAIKFDDDEIDSNKGPRFDKTYQGKSGSGSIPVNAVSSFGKIILGEAGAGDMKGDGKSKSRTT